tara:strand:+ start:288 stop:431 length:144 start_codon:yes stop_codon:yes gene_type:complete
LKQNGIEIKTKVITAKSFVRSIPLQPSSFAFDDEEKGNKTFEKKSDD